MKKYTTILFEKIDHSIFVRFNRPEVHNAFNSEMITELTDCFIEINKLDDIRLVVLKGEGKSFCAGADLNYMKGIAEFGYEENYKDSLKLAGLFQTVYDCEVPVISLVHGAVFGGANGMVAASDIVIAEEQTTFAFSEVKLGIAPATIGPFVFRKIGENAARELMLTGKKFDGIEAARHGLVNHVLPKEKIQEILEFYIKQFKTSAPKAVKATKELIRKISDKDKDIKIYTADLIARLRASDEGQEGMKAFFEKRKPGWV